MNGNIYEEPARYAKELYHQYLSGNLDGPVLVIHEQPLEPNQIGALEKSTAALGFGEKACLYCTIGFNDGDASLDKLDECTILPCLEGFDPLAIVAVDPEPVKLLMATYRLQGSAETVHRANGRDVSLLPTFRKLLETPEGKQKVWASLKMLAHTPAPPGK